MAEIDILNLIVIPGGFTILALLANLYSRRIEKYLKKGRKRRQLLFFLQGFRIQLGDWHCTIAAPLLATLLLAFAMDGYFTWLRQPFVSYNEPLWLSSLTSGFLAPISEEFIFRGFFISFAIFLGMRMIKPYTKKDEFIVNNAALFVIAFFFALGHPNSSIFDFAARFMLGLFCGVLYLLSERNLLPPIVAHAAWNWYLITKGVL